MGLVQTRRLCSAGPGPRPGHSDPLTKREAHQPGMGELPQTDHTSPGGDQASPARRLYPGPSLYYCALPLHLTCQHCGEFLFYATVGLRALALVYKHLQFPSYFIPLGFAR